MQGKVREMRKNLALLKIVKNMECDKMYKFASKQIQFEDFNQPVGLHMNSENRWIKKAECIPWDEIENKYAKLFKNKKGNVAKPLRLALGACIIQAEYNFSDEETALQIQETPYLQFFCGFPGYVDERPFDPSLMVYFRKRLTSDILGEINELIIEKAQNTNVKKEICKDNNNDEEPPQNNGTLIVDATCAPSQIKFPQDVELLNEARENTEKMIDEMHDSPKGKRPRTYRKKAHKDYLNFARSKKRTKKHVRKSVKKQLNYLRRNLNVIDQMMVNGKTLEQKHLKRLETVKKLYDQQKYMYDNKTHSVANRIISLSQPYLRPIVRGKAKSPVEFGVKLDISVANGFVRLEKQSFDAYNEAFYFKEVIERYKERTGSFPQRILADKLYRNRDNLNYCKERGISLSGPALGRPKKNQVINKKQEYVDICDRVEVERDFSLAKSKCGLGLITTRLKETTEHVVALSILVLNLKKVLCSFFDFLLAWIYFCMPRKKLAFVQ